jgi:hypothetical protein
MMFVTTDIVLRENPRLVMTETCVPTIAAMLRLDLARIPTTLLLAVMVMLALTIFVREEFVCLVLVRTVTMVMLVPTTFATLRPVLVSILITMLLATTVTLVLRAMFVLVDPVHLDLPQIVTMEIFAQMIPVAQTECVFIQITPYLVMMAIGAHLTIIAAKEFVLPVVIRTVAMGTSVLMILATPKLVIASTLTMSLLVMMETRVLRMFVKTDIVFPLVLPRVTTATHVPMILVMRIPEAVFTLTTLYLATMATHVQYMTFAAKAFAFLVATKNVMITTRVPTILVLPLVNVYTQTILPLARISILAQ